MEFPVLPLAFREFIELHAGTARAPRELFDDYPVLGGFPALRYFGLERSPSIQYLQSVLDTVIVRDVIEHHQVRDVDLFRRLIRYCIGDIGRTFSARSDTMGAGGALGLAGQGPAYADSWIIAGRGGRPGCRHA